MRDQQFRRAVNQRDTSVSFKQCGEESAIELQTELAFVASLRIEMVHYIICTYLDAYASALRFFDASSLDSKMASSKLSKGPS